MNGTFWLFRYAIAVLLVAEWLVQQEPRVHGLALSAPAYDEVTKPVVAPYPATCICSSTQCRCYSQQGTRLGFAFERRPARAGPDATTYRSRAACSASTQKSSGGSSCAARTQAREGPSPSDRGADDPVRAKSLFELLDESLLVSRTDDFEIDVCCAWLTRGLEHARAASNEGRDVGTTDFEVGPSLKFRPLAGEAAPSTRRESARAGAATPDVVPFRGLP